MRKDNEKIKNLMLRFVIIIGWSFVTFLLLTIMLAIMIRWKDLLWIKLSIGMIIGIIITSPIIILMHKGLSSKIQKLNLIKLPNELKCSFILSIIYLLIFTPFFVIIAPYYLSLPLYYSTTIGATVMGISFLVIFDILYGIFLDIKEEEIENMRRRNRRYEKRNRRYEKRNRRYD